MIIYIDIDQTTCYTPTAYCGVPDYKNSVPIVEAIEIVNEAYDAGHKIVYWTARGATTGNREGLRDLTESHLKKWGCKYHELKMDKPYYDLFIDDKASDCMYALQKLIS